MYGNAETIKRINAKIAGTLILPDHNVNGLKTDEKRKKQEKNKEEEKVKA
jgi:hypothetical protein